MKTLIFVMLLFTGNVIAQKVPNTDEMTPESFSYISKMFETNIILARLDDIDIYYNYLTLTFSHGTIPQKQKLALKYAICHVMFATADFYKISTEKLGSETLRVIAWRQLVAMKWMIRAAGGTDANANELLDSVNQSVSFTPNLIHTCTVLDMAMYENMKRLGVRPFPPIGEEPEEPEEKKNQIAS